MDLSINHKLERGKLRLLNFMKKELRCKLLELANQKIKKGR